MKNRLLLLLSLLLIVSCEKDSVPKVHNEENLTSLEIGVDIDGFPSTKASSTYEYPVERQVNNVIYYVFNSSGMLETSFSSSGKFVVLKTVTTGDKTIYAIVNMPESRFSSCRSISELESRCAYLSDLDSYGMPMSGKKAVTITTGTNTVTVSVERLLSRITIMNIYNDLSNSLEGEEIELGAIYLTNLVGSNTITGKSPLSFQWYNFAGRRDNATSPDDFIGYYDDCAFKLWNLHEAYDTVSWGESYCPSCPLYFFPNNTTITDRNGWSTIKSARFTRIVVEAYIKGERYFYPVNLNGAKRNTAYDFYLTLTRPGSLDPDTFDWAEIQDVVIDIGGFDQWDDDFVITY